MIFYRSLLFATLPVCACAATNPNQEFNDRLTAVEKQVKKRTFYNAPAHAQVVDGYNLFLTGDFLYWKAEENGLTYALKSHNPTAANQQGDIHFQDPHFRWDYGFRVGMGFNLPHDHWDLYVNWTRFDTGAHAHTRAGTGEGIFPVYNFASGLLGNNFVSESKAFWKIQLNIIDVELGKEYYVGKKTALRPHLDIRTVFVDQQFTIDYNTPSIAFFDQVHLKNDYWGVGPRVGIDMQWWWNCGFSLCGNADLSLVYGNFSIHQKEEVHNVPHSTIHVHKHLHTARAITDLGLFLSWDHMLFRDTFHIGIKGGWEQHVFFEQNQFVRFVDPFFQGAIVSNQGNLTFQGWTFEVRLDF